MYIFFAHLNIMLGLILLLLITLLSMVGSVLAGVFGPILADDALVTTGGRVQDLTVAKTQQRVYDKYKIYKLPRDKPSFRDFCFPAKYKLQPPQRFVADYMAPTTNNTSLLAFHRIGAGKTCAAISIAERWIRPGIRPIVMMPASLLPGFRSELRSHCPKFQYISEQDREHLAEHPTSERSREILAASNALIDSRYQLFSYNKFAQTRNTDPCGILIIDEVQNINNPQGKFYQSVMRFIHVNPDVRIVLLSATPVFDKALELVSLMRLMRIDCDHELLMEPITPEKQHLIGRLLCGHVSYYEGAPAHVFPRVALHLDICRMSKFQTKWYTAEVETEFNRQGALSEYQISDNFYVKSRARSNIVFPSGLAGTNGLPKLTHSKILNLDKYSCKFAKLMRRLKKRQLSFVYTNFTSFGGVKTIRHCLRANGFVEFNKHGPGPKRFAVWTGKQTSREKDRIRAVYNSRANDDASQLQIIVGSSAMKEGVSLLRTRQVHVLEPYWNHSRHAQIFGRASRFCSHKTLPARDRTVDIYLYLAVANWSKLNKQNISKGIFSARVDPTESVDLYILNIANQKDETIQAVNQVLKQCAVDRLLNQTTKK